MFIISTFAFHFYPTFLVQTLAYVARVAALVSFDRMKEMFGKMGGTKSLFIILMNPNYSSPRNMGQTAPPSMPFYHPQKELHPPPTFSSPNYPRSPKSAHFLPPNPQLNSKSYTVKPQYEPVKTSGNSSGYLKSSLEYAPQDPSFIYAKGPSEMTKSSFHDVPKTSEIPQYMPNEGRLPASQTPPRRQPRFSEPAMFDSPFQSTQDTKASFIPYGRKEPEAAKEQQKQVHFYKKPTNTPEQTKEEKEGREWLRHSARNKKTQKTISLENFEMVKSLGKGKYGQVYLARQKSCGFIVALKVIQKSILIEQGIGEQFIREVKIQMFLNHPNIIKLYGCFDDEKNIYIILEVAMGGQLFQQLKRSQPLPEVRVASIMKQVCTAVDQLHASKIIHRDIKPQNIVMHEGVYKLCDFGWSVALGNKMRTTFCGTPLYVCPQILKGNEYDQKIDIWSLGIMMYEMLVGENPFKISKEEELIKIVKEQIAIPSYVYVSKEARDFLDKALQKNPTDRVTIKQLVNHQFFLKNAEKEKAEKKMVL